MLPIPPITRRRQLLSRIKRLRGLYLLLLIPVAHIIIFSYVPMYGLTLAFKDFMPKRGILGSPWNDFAHFIRLFGTPGLLRLIVNSLRIGLLGLIFVFPAGILFALAINEVRFGPFKRVVQSISYLPHFLSWVVVGSLFKMMLSYDTGAVNLLLVSLGGPKIPFLTNSNLFLATLVITNIWKSMGWGSIIYLAALSSINPELYDSANIDGANRWHRIWYINLPNMLPTISIMLIFNVGSIMNTSFDQIFNLYNALVMDVSDVFETYIYRVGLIDYQYDYTTAVGLFKNIVSLVMIVMANYTIRRMSEYSLW